MTPHGWLLIAVFVLLVGVTIRPLGGYMAWVFSGQCASHRFLGLFERAFFRMAFIDPSREQNWFGYTQALLLFNLAGVIVLFGILLLQGSLPLQSARLWRRGAGSCIQHRSELCHQHELAGLRGGNNSQLF